MLCKKTEAQQTSVALNRVTICATHCLVLSLLQAFDTADAKNWRRKKQAKDRRHLRRLRSGRCSVSPKSEVRTVARKRKRCTATSHSESRWDRGAASQTNSWQKVDVIRATRERVQLCQDPQREFALHRESPGVNRINHIFRAHGHTNLLTQEAVANTFDEVGQGSLEKLFPGFRNRVQEVS